MDVHVVLDLIYQVLIIQYVFHVKNNVVDAVLMYVFNVLKDTILKENNVDNAI